jgi:hypothetical protein
MMTAQLRPETPSLQKLRNETLEKTESAQKRNTNTNKRTNERTHAHSLNQSLTPRVLTRETLIGCCDFHTENGQNQNLDHDFEVVFNNCNRSFVAGAQNSDLRFLIGRSP